MQSDKPEQLAFKSKRDGLWLVLARFQPLSNHRRDMVYGVLCYTFPLNSWLVADVGLVISLLISPSFPLNSFAGTAHLLSSAVLALAIDSGDFDSSKATWERR